jgi:hypothetical protein
MILCLPELLESMRLVPKAVSCLYCIINIKYNHSVLALVRQLLVASCRVSVSD